MTQQIAYLNGTFLPLEQATISTQDRGFLFGDGVYEVIPVYQGKIFECEAHLQRLENSLAQTGIKNPKNNQAWLQLLQKLVDLHPWENQFLYLQVTRGVQMQRDHLPQADLEPTVYAYTNPLKPLTEQQRTQGIKVITLEDIRWLNCQIKAITLLPNVMLKLAAKQQGADDVILYRANGQLTEGSASNVIIVQNGQLKTPPLSHEILPGITRQVVQNIAKAQQIPFIETPLTLGDLAQADEIWLTSSTKDALPVCELNSQPVGTGKPGAVWQQFQSLFQTYKDAYINTL